ncbi:MAG TPA: crosslink repair DNA glycosylase YcaQ family protein [Chloroflexota bacterium]|jgi:hypothetical protein
MSTTLSLEEARRLAIVSQAFGRRPVRPTMGHVRKLAAQIHAFQIDSVNVLVRAHYVPAFARLGPYPMDALDTLTYRRRELFEYWGHAACLLPMHLFPLVRYRMQSDLTREYIATDRGAPVAQAYAEVAERGPITAGELSNPGKRSGNWWGWASGKAALEYLYDAGLVAIAGRRGFERQYDLVERVIPREVLEVTIPREEAMKQLICLAAQAYGVGTFQDIVGYFNTDGWRDRMRPGLHWERAETNDPRRVKPVARRLVAELVDEGRLLPALVDGWSEVAYVHPAARVPPSVHARALVTPFDSLVWERKRIHRLFGMKYSIELYTPIAKRVYGYYVCPFLLGETLVARIDLKADRQRRVLVVQGAFLEPGHQARDVVDELLAELRQMQGWLELEAIEVVERGDLAAPLRVILRSA